MQVIKSKFNGFCPGVKRAISILNEAKRQFKNPCLSSPLIHNRDVVEKLKVPIISDELPFDCLVISAHSCDFKLLEDTKRADIAIKDATCPIVAANIKKALEHIGDIIYLGDVKHSEVKFFLTYLAHRNIVVFSEYGDIVKFLESKKELIDPIVVMQTTFSSDFAFEAVKLLKNKYPSITIANPICPDCLKRREDALNLAHTTDAVIVVGDENSSNAKELCNIAKTFNNFVYLVLNASELTSISFPQGLKKAGVISSASSSYFAFSSICSHLANMV